MNYKFWKTMNGKRAIVTGASDGIGRELAIQLSKKVDVILIGRNEEKLMNVKKLCSGNPEIRVYDFSKNCEFEEFDNIGLLINNAGVSSDHPNYLVEENRLDEILYVNCLNTIKITKKVLPDMMKQKSGYIVNVGSMMGYIPGPMLSIYSGSKALLRSWSESLYHEMLPMRVNVQLMDTAYVATKMSKIRRKSFFVPDAKTYASAILSSIGSQKIIIPYFPHLIQFLIIEMMPRELIGIFVLFYANSQRLRALKKVK